MASALAELTPAQYNELIRKLEDVCRQAQEIARQIRASMLERARRDLPAVRQRIPERRKVPRKAR